MVMVCSQSVHVQFRDLFVYVGATGANAEHDEGVVPSSPDPRSYAMDGQAIEPAIQYVQKIKQRCDPDTYQQFLDILSRFHYTPDATDEVRFFFLRSGSVQGLTTRLGGSVETYCEIVQGCTGFACWF
jgi:hypothetical protein